MRPPLGRWWLLIWLQPLSAPPAGAVRGEEEAAAALAVPRCKALKEMDLIKTSESDCYCYNRNSRMEWKYMWSTLQVKITSSGLLNIAYITGRHNCQYPETILSFIKCVIHNFWTPKESNEVTIIINPYGETMCFSVKPVRKIFIYTIRVNRNIVDFKLFLVFVAGILLFFYAKTLSRSPIFFYSSGTVLGVLMTLVFVLLLVKRFIPKYSTFWALMVGCWFASVYVVCHLMEDLKWLWHENRIYILGYVLVAGFLSFAVCYKHGPLVDERSVTLLTWTLRLLALVLIYCGVTVPQGSYAALILILASRSLRYPLKAFTYMRWKMKKWWTSKKPVFKYLTEDEYREQADAETSSALEELRGACRRPDFPTWLVVSRLQAPNKYFTLGTDCCPGEPMMRKLSVALLFLQCSDLHRAANVRTNSDLMFDTEGRKHNFHMRSDRCRKFADFVLGGSHLSPEEISLHEEQYGFGGAFLEEQLFNLRTA